MPRTLPSEARLSQALNPDDVETICEYCNQKYWASQYSLLCDAIMNHKAACSLECNIALGQVHDTQ
jgi:hypothetical protein